MSSSGPQPQRGTLYDWMQARPMIRNACIAGIVIVLIGLGLGVQAKASRLAAANQSFSGGAGGSDNGQNQDAGVASASESVPIETSTPDPTDTPIQFTNNAPILNTNGTLNSGGPVILPATTSPIDTSTLFSARDIDTSIFDTVEDASGGSASFEGLVEFDVAANGLKPEYHELDFVRVSADGSSTTAQKKLLTSSDEGGAEPVSVWGVNGGLLIVGVQGQTSDSGELHHTWALDPSGTVVWKSSAELRLVVGDVPIVQSSYTAKDKDGYDTTCQDVSGLNASNGSIRWTISGRSIMARGGSCGSPQVDTDESLDDGTSRAKTQRYVTVQYDDGSDSSNHGANVIPTSGVAVKWRSTDSVTAGVVDPTSGNVFSGEGQDPSSRDLPAEVYDPSTGKVVWSMPYAQAQKLGLEVEYFYGGTLYARNSAQNITIDTASGQVDTSGWSDDDGEGVPYASVDGYTITTTGYVTKD